MDYFTYFINEALTGKDDTSQHKLSLFSLALSIRAKNMLELGVRDGGTTFPLLMAAKIMNTNLTSVDIQENKSLHYFKMIHENWKYVISDALEYLANIPNDVIYDLVFVDDWHGGEHVYKEIQLLEPHITPSSLIILHDCMCYNTQPHYNLHNKHTDFDSGGPFAALQKLDLNVWEYSTIPVNHGLTILRKKGQTLLSAPPTYL